MDILDTSFIIGFLRQKPRAIDLISRLENEIYSTIVTLGELQVGIHVLTPARRQKELTKVNHFIEALDGIIGIDKRVAETYGQIKANLAKKGQLIGDNDTWIAACCLIHKARVITLNLKHFQRVKGLQVLT